MLLIAMLVTPTVADFQPNTWIVYVGENGDKLCQFNLPGQQDNEGIAYRLYLNSGMGYGNVYLKKDDQTDVNIMIDGLIKFTKKTVDNAKVGIDLQMKILSWASLPTTISELAAEKASDIIVDKIVEEYIKSADEYVNSITGKTKTTSAIIPKSASECETGTYTFCGTFTLDGNHFNAVWDNGAIAELEVIRWDSSGVELRRKDIGGVSNGLDAKYTGIISGDKIENGRVIWGQTSSGTWNANW